MGFQAIRYEKGVGLVLIFLSLAKYEKCASYVPQVGRSVTSLILGREFLVARWRENTWKTVYLPLIAPDSAT